MLGKLASVHTLVKALRRHKVRRRAHQIAYALTEFVQGQTKRWGVAWSFCGSRLPDALTSTPALASLAPTSHTRSFACDAALDVGAFLLSLPTLPLDQCVLASTRTATHAELYSACWTRGARRKRARHEPTERSSAPVLAVAVRRSPTHVHVDWTYGFDRVLFDSFAVHLAGQLPTLSGARAHPVRAPRSASPPRGGSRSRF